VHRVGETSQARCRIRVKGASLQEDRRNARSRGGLVLGEGG
jgi:hypothetical protein